MRATIYKIDENQNIISVFLEEQHETWEDAILYLKDSRNEPVIDCAGYRTEIDGKVIDIYLYGVGYIERN